MPAVVIFGGAAGGGAGRLARRVLAALPLSALLLALVALPASAHAVGGATPTNYDTRILSVSPQVPGVQVRVVEAGARLELVNTSGQDVIVPGYGGEPYLKVGPGGIEENTRSPATYVNQTVDGTTKAPPEANPAAAPVWRHIGDGDRVAWHDHRTHWMAPDPPRAVRQNPGREHVINPEWRIDLQRAGQPIVVKGDLRWVPGPSATPWLIGAAILALVLLLASRTPAWAPVLGGAVVLLILIDVVHTIGVWTGLATSVPVKLYGSVVPVAGWLVGILAVMRLRSGQRESGVFFALFAAALALVSALGDLSALSSSQLVGSLPEWVTRLAVAARVGLAAGIALAGLIAMRRTAMPSRPAPSSGQTAAAGLLLATMLAGGLLLAAAPPASAHGREVLLRATATIVPGRPPGTVRVVAVATYLDGDRATGLTVRAVATGAGREAFALRPADQRGVYAATVALRPGVWTITVTASVKAKGQTTIRITVPTRQPAAPTTAATAVASTTTATTTTQPPDTTEPAVDEEETATSEEPDASVAAAPAGARGGGGGGIGVIVAALAIGGLAALGTGGILLLRRRP